MPDTLTLGLVQMSMSTDRADNLRRAAAHVRDAAAQGATVVCLPELFLSRYFCQTEDSDQFSLAEPVPGPTTDALAPLAAELDVVVVASLFEKRARGLYHNTAAVIDGKDGYLGKYRKMHIPDDPLFYEKYYFAPGDLGFKNWDTSRGQLGVLVCWDQWYPEAARLTALQGSEVLFYPTAIGWHPGEKTEYGEAQRDAWVTSMRAHAVANGVYVVGVNRTGFEPTHEADAEALATGRGIEFWGSSFVVGPDGRILTQMDETTEGVAVVEAPLGDIDSIRHGWPFLRDRRTDAYGEITSRYGR